MAQRLLRQIVRSGPTPPTLTFPKLLALVIAGLMHIFVLFVAVSGILLTYASFHMNAYITIMGIFLIVLAFAMRPRISRIPKYNVVAERDFPTLYRVTDEVASRLGTRRVDLLLITTHFNAFFYRAGWSRKNVLCLGMPLFEILTPQERVALIAHELGHSANGDASRTFFISSAIRSLYAWRDMFVGDGDFIILSLTFLLVGLPRLIALILGLIATGLVLLLANESQRAEYLADGMAARVAGTEAMLNLLHKLHMAPTLGKAMDNFYETGARRGVFEALRRKVAHVPPRELERVARVEKSLDARLDSTHPPTAYRIELLKARPVTHPDVVVSTADIDAIERELSQIRPDLETVMLESFRTRMNY
jgi:Zn-dependent protease with chaperone function